MFCKDILTLAETGKNIPNIIYGDTDSIFINLEPFLDLEKEQDEIVKDTYKICDEIQEYINKDVINHFIKIHNLNPSSSVLNFKQEVIAKRALFLETKKTYALDIIDKERNKLPHSEYEIKGIETRRSDFSKTSKELIIKLLDMILRENKTIPEIMEFLSEERKKVRDKIISGDKTTARPVSFVKSEYDKVVPGHIRAMFAWNELMGSDFRVGTKGYMYYIKDVLLDKAPPSFVKKYTNLVVNKKEKLTQIALPDTKETLPEYFVVDDERMLEMVFDKRCSRILSPIGVAEINWKREEEGILSW